MRGLTFRKEGDADVDEFVAEGLVVVQGGIADVQDGRVGAVEPGSVDA